MSRKLRSNFPRGSYFWAVRRAQWRALGIPDSDMEKPKVAVVNTSSELSSCFSHLDQVAEIVKQGVRAAGGLPFEIRTAAPSDFIIGAGGGGGYILATRDLIPNEIEIAVEGAQLDGMVLLASCDKTAPGQLMAAARLNIPSIVVCCGYQQSGEYAGRHCDIEDVFLHSMHVATGTLSVEALEAMSGDAIRSPGVCSGMGTANSMHLVCEALGMALPGSTPVAAMSPKMLADARRAGERVVAMIEADLKPRDILTPAAFANAARAVLAVSGSINCVKHLQAVAHESGCGADVYELFRRFSPQTPVLSAVRPIGDDSIEAFEAAGGTRAVLKQLAPRIESGARTVTGRTLGEELTEATVIDDTVIRPLARPFADKPSIVLVRGSLAPDGGIVKLGIDPAKPRCVEGRAVVFTSADAAIAALNRGEIRAGHVVVLRGLGPRGRPGMGMASRIVFALDGKGLGEHCAVVTDGQLSGLVNKGLVVGEVQPEAAAGGAIGLVEPGDRIVIDLEVGRCDLDVSEAVLADRRARGPAPAAHAERGWLGIYAERVAPLAQGAVITAAKK